MRTVRSHLTYANAMATIAVFVALGGSGYAAVTINGRTIRNRSIPGKKLKDRTITRSKVAKNALTGTEVNETKLGTVARAANADTLQGQHASELKLRCPSGTAAHAAACFETGLRGPLTWVQASRACGLIDRRLPTVSELESFRQEPGITLGGVAGASELILNTYDTADNNGGAVTALTLRDNGDAVAPDAATFRSDKYKFRCVARAVN